MDLLATTEKMGIKGFMHPAELEKLVELAVNRHVLEVGSFMGLSAYGMACVARRVTCVDTFRAISSGQQQMDSVQTLDAFMAATSRFNNVSVVVGTSESAAAGTAVPAQFDMVFLDAMHTYEDVKADIARWYPRVRPGGLMVFHDYGHGDFPGVKQAVDELFGPQQNTVGTLAWMVKP